MERSFLTEAFKSLSILQEEDFNMNDAKDKEEMTDFTNDAEEQEFIDVIDPTAETEEDLDDSYVGKVICDCMTCHSKIYKLPTDIILDKESGLANVGEECPYCFDSTGFKIIGEVANYTPEEPEAENPDATVEDDIGLDADAEEKPAEEPTEEKPEEEIEEALNEELENVEVKTEDGAVEITKEPGKTTIEIKEEAEDFEDVPVPEEPIENPIETPAEVEGAEIIPVSPETQDLITSTSDEVTDNAEEGAEIVDDVAEPLPEDEEEVDYDLDDFDEESFDGLGESYLKRVYENVNSFKTTEVRQKDNKLMLEGIIKFNSGKEKKTSFIFEATEATSNGKVKFLGENAQISRGKKSFALRGNISDKKFISESFTYNYMTKDVDDNSVRLYGTIKRNK